MGGNESLFLKYIYLMFNGPGFGYMTVSPSENMKEKQYVEPFA
jgi:GTP-binding protein EngB required for normal cell division